jgi:hypothetical protein
LGEQESLFHARASLTARFPIVTDSAFAENHASGSPRSDAASNPASGESAASSSARHAGPAKVTALHAIAHSRRDVKETEYAVWFLMAKDEGHGFAKKKNADFQFYSTVQFIRENLLK